MGEKPSVQPLSPSSAPPAPSKEEVDLAWDDDAPEVAPTSVTPPAMSISASLAPSPRGSDSTSDSFAPSASSLAATSDPVGAFAAQLRQSRPSIAASAPAAEIPSHMKPAHPSLIPSAPQVGGNPFAQYLKPARSHTPPPSAAVALAIGQNGGTPLAGSAAERDGASAPASVAPKPLGTTAVPGAAVSVGDTAPSPQVAAQHPVVATAAAASALPEPEPAAATPLPASAVVTPIATPRPLSAPRPIPTPTVAISAAEATEAAATPTSGEPAAAAATATAGRVTLADEASILAEATLPDLTAPSLDALMEPTLPDLTALKSEDPTDSTDAAAQAAAQAAVSTSTPAGEAPPAPAVPANDAAAPPSAAHAPGAAASGPVPAPQHAAAAPIGPRSGSDEAVATHDEKAPRDEAALAPGNAQAPHEQTVFAPDDAQAAQESAASASADARPPQEAAAVASAVPDASTEEAPSRGPAPVVSSPEPSPVVHTLRPAQLDNLESLVEPPKPRRAGGIVAAVTAFAVIGGALFFALRPSADENGAGAQVLAANPTPEGAGEPGKAPETPAAEQAVPAAPASSKGSVNEGSSAASDARLSNAFASAIKDRDKEKDKTEAADAPEERGADARAGVPTADEKAPEANPQKREDAPKATAARSKVTTVSIRTVPGDADIYDHRGKRVGIGSAKAEVEPRAKYTYTILRHGYKPRKITLSGAETEMVIELERAFPKK